MGRMGKRILLAGATGYLGSYILSELRLQDYDIRVIARHPEKLADAVKDSQHVDVKVAEVTKPDSIMGCCNDVDTVISTVGITRQNDGLTYMDVDYQANLNLLNEAMQAGVRKFIYVSVLNGEKLRNINICRAKEMFVDKLKLSGLEYCVVRPNGFFSDIKEFYDMAKKGRVYLFGDGNTKVNPIHGEDLALECVSQIESKTNELLIGGPEVLTQDQIAETAFDVLDKPVKITHFPDWIRHLTLGFARLVMRKQSFGPLEFFLNVSAMDMIAPCYGDRTLDHYFRVLKKSGL